MSISKIGLLLFAVGVSAIPFSDGSHKTKTGYGKNGIQTTNLTGKKLFFLTPLLKRFQ